MSRMVVKIAGESGTGIESSGVVIMKSLKNLGYYIFADREFPSLIKGGVANYQINFSDTPIYSLSKKHDVCVAVDRQGLYNCLETIKPYGLLINGFESWKKTFPNLEDKAKEKDLFLVQVPTRSLIRNQGASSVMVNTLLIGVLWKILGFPLEVVQANLVNQFRQKPHLVDLNLRCLQIGCDFVDENFPEILESLPKTNTQKPDNRLLVDGNTALSLGAIHCGVRAYYAYPMSPASSILSFLAKTANQTGIVVKQAEDEITAVQMTLGSMHVGTRAFTATSGGGFDLMTETVSLAGMIETPLVVVIAQRPGPATGLPTWTAQGDLNLAIYSSHGEFAKIVLACSDPESAYTTIQQAFNLSEKFQCPVILLTEKTIAESKVTIFKFPENTISIDRGLINTDEEVNLKPADRYTLTETGVSKRWLPGQSKVIYFANGDEHQEDGSLDETEKVAEMIWKRVKKLQTIADYLPEPEVFGPESDSDISFVGWGSSKNAVLDAMNNSNLKINYLHFTYLWPLKTNKLIDYFAQKQNVHLVEGNVTGQLGQLIAQQTGLTFAGKLLKWNGRPFYFEEVLDYAQKNIDKKNKHV